MKKISVAVSILVLLLSAQATYAYNYSKVILIVWDGTEYDTFEYLFNMNRLQGLKEFYGADSLSNGSAQNGSFAKLYITDHITWTDSGHATMLTGFNSDITNTSDIGEPKYQIIPENLTLFEKLNQSGVITAAILSRDGAKRWTNNDSIVQDKSRDGLVGHGFMQYEFQNAIGSMQYFWDPKNFSVENNIYIYYNNKTITNVSTNETVYFSELKSKIVEQYVEKWLYNHTQDRFFLFVHFGDPDAAGHNSTCCGELYQDAIIADADSLNKITNFIKTLGIDNSTIVILTTDHGFFKSLMNHHGAPYPTETIYGIRRSRETFKTFVMTNKKIWEGIPFANQTDLAPTIYELMNISSESITPVLNGTSIWNKPSAWVYGEREDSWNEILDENTTETHNETGSKVVGIEADNFDRRNGIQNALTGNGIWWLSRGARIFNRSMMFEEEYQRAIFMGYSGSDYNVSVRLVANDMNISSDDVKYIIPFYIQDVADLSASAERYYVRIRPNSTATCELYKIDEGVITRIGSTVNKRTWNNMDILTIQTSSVGNGLKIYQNGVLYTTITAGDSTFTSGGSGLEQGRTPEGPEKATYKNFRIWNTTAGNLTGFHDFGIGRYGKYIKIISPNLDANLTASLYLSANGASWNLYEKAVVSNMTYDINQNDRNQTQFWKLTLNANFTDTPEISEVLVYDEAAI